MKTYFLSIWLCATCFCFVASTLNGQELPDSTSVSGRIVNEKQLVDLLQDIAFTEKQFHILGMSTTLLKFTTDTNGAPSLQQVIGVEDKGIIDSFYNKFETVQQFVPTIHERNVGPNKFELSLSFPRYFDASIFIPKLPIGNFKNVEYTNARFDYGGTINYSQYAGGANRSIGYGVSLRLEATVTFKDRLVYGLHLLGKTNKLKDIFPNIESNAKTYVNSIMGGITFGKRFDKWAIYSDLNYGNFFENKSAFNYKGVSFGLLGEIPLSKYSKTLSQTSLEHMPYEKHRELTLRFGVRYQYFGIAEANGIQVEIGLAQIVSRNEVSLVRWNE